MYPPKIDNSKQPSSARHAKDGVVQHPQTAFPAKALGQISRRRISRIFFDLLNCSPSSTPEVIQENIRCLLQLLHPDKTPSVPPYASQFIPIVSNLKTIRLDPGLLPVYKCCDFFGGVRRQRGYRSCKKCDPFL